MKRIIVCLLLAAVLSVNAFAWLDFDEAPGKTNVNFRLVVHEKQWLGGAEMTINIAKYNAVTGEREASDEVHVYRHKDYQRDVWLEPGIYKIVLAYESSTLDFEFYGFTDEFEIKGDKMTVYCAIENEKNRVDMPAQTVVYGEDTQNFGIWAEKKPVTFEVTTAIDSDDFETTSYDDETYNYITIIVDPDTPATDSEPSETSGQSGDDKRSKVNIGNIVFITLVICIVVGSGIGYFVYKRRKTNS